MQIKLFEIRDSATMIPVMAIKPALTVEVDKCHLDLLEKIAITEKELFLWQHAGYSMRPDDPIILVIKIVSEECSYSRHHWRGGERTMPIAHEFIEKNWGTLKSGDLIDVEYILKETLEPKTSEMHEILGV